jgi:conjugal transfer pilus assembly protein TrbC
VPPRTDRLSLALVALLSLPAVAAEPAWPSRETIDRVRQSRPFPDSRAIERAPVARPPRVEPPATGTDVEALARQHATAKIASRGQPPELALRIFVTLDMPAASLRALAEQAARSGAALVLRGLKDQSMRATLAQLERLTAGRNVAWQIDPQAFTRFAVAHAPTFVLVTSSGLPEQACASDCPTSATYVAVAGDVTLDYALHAMVRQVPSARPHAAPFLSRLKERP